MLAEDRFGFYWVDLGLVGLSWIIGIPAVICLLVIIYKNVKYCRGSGIQYVRFTLIAVTLASAVTSMELFRNGNMVIIGLMLYIISRANEDSLDELVEDSQNEEK